MRHNKKRNAALIYEQLIRYISRALVEGKTEKASIANSIVKEHFSKGSQLYKEFRLFNSLMRTTVNDQKLALRIIDEARKASQDHDSKKLYLEKSKLIASINKRLDESNFFDIKVPEYRDLATVQTLLNDWRLPSVSNINRLVEYEMKVVTLLQSEKTLPPLVESNNSSNLSVRLLTEKVSKKFSENLTKEQLQIVSLSTKGDFGSLHPILEKTKISALKSMKMLRANSDNATINEKLESVESVLKSLDTKNISESNISKFLVITKLIEEANGDKNE